MAAPRELTDQAIDCALHGMPEPSTPWRNELPDDQLKNMNGGGSGQIGLQGLVACLLYGIRAWAVAVLNHYADLCERRFMLSEPWSRIYGTAIVCCWLGVVILAEKVGEISLAKRFRSLLMKWAATCALMEVRMDGKWWVFPAGCRSYGGPPRTGGMHQLWRIARGDEDAASAGSRKYGTPGALDDWGWRFRCAAIGQRILRECAAPYVGKPPLELLASMPRWAARVPMQLVGYADGSREWVMGADEPERVDDDPNNNTPGLGYAGVRQTDRGPQLRTLPPGEEHKRPKGGVQMDVDGSPATGWFCRHSHFGDRKEKGEWLSSIEPYTRSELLFWIEIPAESLDWIHRHRAAGAPPAPPGAPPAPPSSPAPPEKPRRRRRRGHGCAVSLLPLLAAAALWAAPNSTPDKIVWLDVTAFVYERTYDRNPDDENSVPAVVKVYGLIRQTTRGAAGAPWPKLLALPTPTKLCTSQVAGEFDTPTSPWFCPHETVSIHGRWTVARPPPLDNCHRTTTPRKQSGYVCTAGVWRPEVWQ